MSDDNKERVIGVTRRGTPVTEELAEELAREAEAGYDLSTFTRVGRPSLAGSAGMSPRLHFRVSAELYSQAAERAEREGKSISEVAREALERYLKS